MYVRACACADAVGAGRTPHRRASNPRALLALLSVADAVDRCRSRCCLLLKLRSRPAPGQDADFGRKRDAAREAQLARCRAEEEATTARSELTPLCRSISSDDVEWARWIAPLYAPGMAPGKHR